MIDREEVGHWLDFVAKLSAVAGAGGFAASLIYDWGYFRALGLDFSAVPTSLADHVRSSLLWLPAMIVSYGVVFLLELATRRLEHGKTEEELIAASRNPKFTRAFRRSPYVALEIMAYFIAAYYLLFGDVVREGLALACTALWFRFVVWVNGHPAIAAKRSPAVIVFMLWGGLMGIWVFNSGSNAAYRASTAKDPGHVIVLRNNEAHPVRVTLARAFERGLLIKAPGTTSVEFVPWGEIRSVMTTSLDKPYRGILCQRANMCTGAPVTR